MEADKSILLKWIFKKWNADVDWIDMAQDRALVIGVTKFRVP